MIPWVSLYYSFLRKSKAGLVLPDTVDVPHIAIGIGIGITIDWYWYWYCIGIGIGIVLVIPDPVDVPYIKDGVSMTGPQSSRPDHFYHINSESDFDQDGDFDQNGGSDFD